jgi:hypothetical protein
MDYSYLYSTRIQKTFDEDQADILSILKAESINNPKFEIQLINYYKGLPVSSKAKFAEIEKDALDLDITPQQAIAILTEHYTFIRSKIFKHAVLAKAQYVSVKHNAVCLRKFCYVEIMAEQRNHVRLKLEPSINAVFNSSSGIVRGKLVELSMAGAVMSVVQPFDEVIGEEANLTIMIPDVEQNTTYNIKLPAKLIKTLEETKPRQYRFSITADDRISDRVIAKYLYHRQVDIIRELKEASELGVNQHSMLTRNRLPALPAAS